MTSRPLNTRPETNLDITRAQSMRPDLGLGMNRNLEVPLDLGDGLQWLRVLSLGGGCDDPDRVAVRVQAIGDSVPARPLRPAPDGE